MLAGHFRAGDSRKIVEDVQVSFGAPVAMRVLVLVPKGAQEASSLYPAVGLLGFKI